LGKGKGKESARARYLSTSASWARKARGRRLWRSARKRAWRLQRGRTGTWRVSQGPR